MASCVPISSPRKIVREKMRTRVSPCCWLQFTTRPLTQHTATHIDEMAESGFLIGPFNLASCVGLGTAVGAAAPDGVHNYERTIQKNVRW